MIVMEKSFRFLRIIEYKLPSTMVIKKIILLCCFSILIMSYQGLKAQVQDSSRLIQKPDSTKPSFVAKMQAFAKRSAKESADEFDSDRAVMGQVKTFEEIRMTMQKAKVYLRTTIDTVGTRFELNEIQHDFQVAGDGVFTKKGTVQTFRNLTATSKILSELLSKANARKLSLDNRQHDLNNFRFQLDSLLSVPSLFKFPTDSLTLMRYLQKIKVVAYDIHPIDSTLKTASNNIQALLNEVNMVVSQLQVSLDEIEGYQKNMAINTYKREFDNIWGAKGKYRPFSEILNFSKIKGLLTLSFYAENNAGKIFILLSLILTSFIYLRSLKSIYIKGNHLKPDFEGQLVLKYLLPSATLIVISLFQFIFLSPPFILNVIFWLVACISLTAIFRKFITPYWMNVWLIMVFFFVLAAIDNLVLQASRTERWFMLVVAAAGFITGIVILLKGRQNELREKWITYSIGFMVLMEAASLLANIFGRYNLAKTLFIGGYLNVVIAILFLWTVRLINEGLFLAFNVYSGQDRKLFYLNFEKVGQKAPFLLYFLLVIGWMILLGRNFPAFEYFSKPLKAFFVEDRTIGNYTFSIISLLLFLIIMFISVIVSKIVSFFASDRHLVSDREDKHEQQGIGSWLLLVRIFILSIGLFLAIAAAGIPMDRITIVLGALGVGIGFGLQALVNNLVSGLIIAFEKPVNVGDIVDVDGQAGTMKSIGFRSSVISTWEGADVVMPNGDLLNSHLINWSLAGNRKRMSISLGIAYHSDLEKCKQVLTELLDLEPRINKNPPPVIQYEQFNTSTIDLRILFWTKHMRDGVSTKSDLIIAITAAFKVNGIEIPFPQQDVHIHYPDQNTDGHQ
jgi:potassium efflux system protein